MKKSLKLKTVSIFDLEGNQLCTDEKLLYLFHGVEVFFIHARLHDGFHSPIMNKRGVSVLVQRHFILESTVLESTVLESTVLFRINCIRINCIVQRHFMLDKTHQLCVLRKTGSGSKFEEITSSLPGRGFHGMFRSGGSDCGC